MRVDSMTDPLAVDVPLVLDHREIAYHLAAHVVVAVHSGGAATDIRLPSSEGVEPWDVSARDGLCAERHIERATSSLAGPIAECLTLGVTGSMSTLMYVARQLVVREDEVGVTEDLQEVWIELAEIFQLDLVASAQAPEREAAWNWLTARAVRLVDLWWDEITSVATELLITGSLGEARLHSLLSR